MMGFDGPIFESSELMSVNKFKIEKQIICSPEQCSLGQFDHCCNL